VSSGGLRLEPTCDPSWLLVEEGVDQAREHEIESIFAVANGYVGTRASLEEGSTFSNPGTFAAGVYARDPGSGLGPTLAVLPDWAHVEVAVDGRRVCLEAGRVLQHRQGVLWREWRLQDPAGRVTRMTFLRLAALADRHVLVQSVTVTAENYAGRLRLTARLGGVETGADLLVRVNDTTVAFATASELRRPEGAEGATHEGGHPAGEESWSWDAGLGETAHLDRTVVVFTSRDVADPAGSAAQHLVTVRPLEVQGAVQAHVEAWRHRWRSAEVRVVGDERAQRALRFAVYHLVAAANPDDEHASIGARGLTDEAYRGHVFWDTEIYLLPFYVYTDPPAARALLMYRDDRFMVVAGADILVETARFWASRAHMEDDGRAHIRGVIRVPAAMMTRFTGEAPGRQS
jgi:trehalose/maltose hydrolase-like predicted phosphorylase